MAYTGFSNIQNVVDLFRKLERDYLAFAEDFGNPDLALNFFFTAHALIDWNMPDGAFTQTDRNNFTKANLLLRVCSHIANGAKHFSATAKQHDTVQGISPPARYFRSNAAGNGALYLRDTRAGLMVKLDGDAEKALGEHVAAHVLAEKILGFWKGHLNL